MFISAMLFNDNALIYRFYHWQAKFTEDEDEDVDTEFVNTIASKRAQLDMNMQVPILIMHV